MCDTAMHHEALRKKRLLERKAAAQQRMSQNMVEDCPPNLDDRRQAQMAAEQGLGMHALHAEQTRMAPTNGISYQHMQYDHSRDGPTRPLSWDNIERQLKHEAKVLRDHNMYMGHTSAFKDLYDRGMLEPGK